MASLSKILFEKSYTYSSLTALRIQGRSISYYELSEWASKIAAALLEFGAKRETIAIVGQRKLSSYIGIVGILYAGCNYVPINPKYNKARIAAMLKDSNVRFLIGDASDLEKLDCTLCEIEGLTISEVIVPEGQVPLGKSWKDNDYLQNVAPLINPVDVKEDDLAYILYTSGSTGEPKGVQVQNSNILAFLRSMSDNYNLEPGFHASQTFDFSFDPSASDMFFTWTHGGVLCVLPEEELLLPSEYINREKITFWNSVPSIASFMNKMGALSPGSFPTLRYSMFCGEQFPKYLADKWKKAAPNSSVENLYGPTEATIYISRYVYTVEEENKEFKNSIIPIGKPFIGHEFVLIDELGNKLSSNGIGEIVYKGPQITKGYLHDSNKTDTVFVNFDWDSTKDKWYKSGDLGFYNDDGNIECIGRIDNQIKLGGRRIEIGEIEAVLGRYVQTQDAIVVPLKDSNDIVIGCVAFTINEINKEDEKYIRRNSETYLERIFFPKKIITIESFPIAPSGKINRRVLTDLARQLITSE